jgi:hypothetical protein
MTLKSLQLKRRQKFEQVMRDLESAAKSSYSDWSVNENYDHNLFRKDVLDYVVGELKAYGYNVKVSSSARTASPSLWRRSIWKE